LRSKILAGWKQNLYPPKFLDYDMYGVYVLRSKKKGTLYIGYSHNVQERIAEHQKGWVPATRDKRPLELLYCELYQNRIDAMRRERFFKSGWGRAYIRRILHNTLKNV
jgi:putative endonuclease